MTHFLVEGPDPVQARELVRLVELEARWENLPKAPSSDVADLRDRQRAYEEFAAALAAYNHRFRPAYRAEVLLSSPVKFSRWCRAVRDLLARVEAGPEERCPSQLVAKAHRLAARLAPRVSRELAVPPGPPAGVRAAIDVFDRLAEWSDETVVAVAAAG